MRVMKVSSFPAYGWRSRTGTNPYAIRRSLYPSTCINSYIITQVTHTNSVPDNINLFVIPTLKFAITRKYFRLIPAITGIVYSVQQVE